MGESRAGHTWEGQLPLMGGVWSQPSINTYWTSSLPFENLEVIFTLISLVPTQAIGNLEARTIISCFIFIYMYLAGKGTQTQGQTWEPKKMTQPGSGS